MQTLLYFKLIFLPKWNTKAALKKILSHLVLYFWNRYRTLGKLRIRTIPSKYLIIQEENHVSYSAD